MYTKLAGDPPITIQLNKSLRDVKVRREADAGSDHILVMSTLSLKLRKAKRRGKRQLRFGVGKLRNRNVEKAFKIEVKNRFTIL